MAMLTQGNISLQSSTIVGLKHFPNPLTCSLSMQKSYIVYLNIVVVVSLHKNARNPP